MDYEWAEDLLNFHVPARQFRERRNPFGIYSDLEFKERFHMCRTTAEDILHSISSQLQHDTARNYSLSPDLQFLITLRFLTCATFQGVCADLFHIHRTSVSRCISNVVATLTTLKNEHLCFPADLNTTKQQFYQYGNFPGVVGCVDGTHIPIYRPPRNPQAEVFRCRKGFFQSIPKWLQVLITKSMT